MTPLVLKAILVTGFAIAIVGLVGSLPMSLAGDVGSTDEDACAAVAVLGGQVVRNLEASGFPHATSASVERYRLTRHGEVEALVEIDWTNDRAACLPLDPETPHTVSFDMNSFAYSAVVRELKHVLETGSTSPSTPLSSVFVSVGTRVVGGDGEPAPGYKRDLSAWAAGKLTTGASA